MRWLAAFILKSRITALLLFTAANILSWVFPPCLIIPGATAALITLRRGIIESFLIILFGIIIIEVIFLSFSLQVPIEVFQVFLIYYVPIILLAQILRSTISISFTLKVSTLLGMIGLIIFYLFIGDIQLWYEHMLTQIQQKMMSNVLAKNLDSTTINQVVVLLKELVPYLAGQYVSTALLSIIAALLLGRWWQALLFNPGGFGTEFQNLYLGQQLPILTIIVFILAITSSWAPLYNVLLVLSIVPALQGIALIHVSLSNLQFASLWLTMFYLLLVPLLSQAVIILGLADTWVDFRNISRKYRR